MELIGAVITLIGSLFLLLGAIGVLRMPDIYNRIQAGTKASTLGTFLTLIGIIFLSPSWVGKLLILIIFVIITNPVSSHVLARAVYFMQRSQDSGLVVDKLKDAETVSESSTDEQHSTI